MGIDLNNQVGCERFRFSAWSDLQLLALLNGWEPEGTYIDYEDPPQWMGYFYNSNSGQTVRRADAINMARALKRALDHLVERPEEVICLDLSQFTWPKVMDDERPPAPECLRAFETYAGPAMRTRIEEFIEFALAGEFSIS